MAVRQRNGVYLPLLLFALSVLFTLASLVLLAWNWSTPVPESWGFRGGLALFAFTFSSVGLLIALRRPENPVGWLYLSASLFNGLANFSQEYAIYALLTRPGVLPGGVFFTWFLSWMWPSIVGLTGVFSFLLFPDGKLLSARWRPVIWTTTLGIVLTTIDEAFRPGLLNTPYADNPFGVEAAAALLRPIGTGGIVLLIFGMVVGAASLIVRFRRGTSTERQQLKWLASASALLAMSFVLSAFGLKWAEDMSIFAMLAIPVSVGIAILRYRLYDIDLLINRTLVYGLVTGSLALLYWGAVLLLQQVFRMLTGASSELAIIISILGIAALFQPMRNRIQSVIDRRFYRRKYDTAKVLASFAATMRDEVELDRLTGRLVEVVEETMQPSHVSLWLREDLRSSSS